MAGLPDLTPFTTIASGAEDAFIAAQIAAEVPLSEGGVKFAGEMKHPADASDSEVMA